MIRYSLCVTTVAAAISSTAMAEDVAQCNGALVQNTRNIRLNVSEKLSILQTVKREDFEKSKQKLSGDGTAILGGIPITENMAWEKYNEERQNFLSKYKSDFSYNESLLWNEIYLSPMAGDNYVACLRSLRGVGAHIYTTSSRPSSTAVAFKIAFYTDGSDKTPRTIRISKTGGTLEMDDEQRAAMTDFVGPKEFDLIFKRSSLSEDALIVVNVTGSTSGGATLSIPRAPQIYEAYNERIGLSTSTTVSANHSNEQGSAEICLPSTSEDFHKMEDFKFVTALTSVTHKVNGGVGDESSAVTMNSESKVCARGNVGGDSWGHGRSVTFTLSAVGERKSWRRIGI